MKKSNLLLLIDVLMFFFLALMTGLGLMIKYILVPGSKRWDIYGRNVDLTFLGMDRHELGTVHLICAILFLSVLVLHIILHWKAFVTYVCKIVNNKTEANILITAFAFALLCIIIFPFLINIKVTELGEGRDRFLHGTEQRHTPAAIQREQNISTGIADEAAEALTRENVESSQELEHHDIDPDIEVYGSMNLINVSVKYNVPVSHIIKELNLPASTSGNEQLGRLRREYGFKMSDIELIIHNYRRK